MLWGIVGKQDDVEVTLETVERICTPEACMKQANS